MQLITVESSTIGTEVKQTVNARELHAFLGVKSEFRHWVKNRIADFDFIEDQDFAVVGKNLPTKQGSRTIRYRKSDLDAWTTSKRKSA